MTQQRFGDKPTQRSKRKTLQAEAHEGPPYLYVYIHTHTPTRLFYPIARHEHQLRPRGVSSQGFCLAEITQIPSSSPEACKNFCLSSLPKIKCQAGPLPDPALVFPARAAYC